MQKSNEVEQSLAISSSPKSQVVICYIDYKKYTHITLQESDYLRETKSRHEVQAGNLSTDSSIPPRRSCYTYLSWRFNFHPSHMVLTISQLLKLVSQVNWSFCFSILIPLLLNTIWCLHSFEYCSELVSAGVHGWRCSSSNSFGARGWSIPYSPCSSLLSHMLSQR